MATCCRVDCLLASCTLSAYLPCVGYCCVSRAAASRARWQHRPARMLQKYMYCLRVCDDRCSVPHLDLECAGCVSCCSTCGALDREAGLVPHYAASLISLVGGLRLHPTRCAALGRFASSNTMPHLFGAGLKRALPVSAQRAFTAECATPACHLL